MQTSYKMRDCESGGKPSVDTEVFVESTTNALLFKFVADNPDPHPRYTEDNMPLYEGDIVEVLLSLDDKSHYLEIEVNQNGAKYAALIDNRDGEGDIDITIIDPSQFTASVAFSRDIWTTSISLPMEWLCGLGYQNDNFCNLLREDFDENGNMNLSCVSPTYSRSFHKTSAFIKL